MPQPVLKMAGSLTTVLTIASMAALGLGVDGRALARVGGPVPATVTASLAILIAIAVLLIAALRLA